MRGRPRVKPVYIDGVPYWRCALCGDHRPAKRYNSNPSKSNGLQSWCRDCQSIRNQRGQVRKALRFWKAWEKRLEVEP